MVQVKSSDPLGGYNPIYNKGQLLGFEKGGTFIPKEAAETKSGSYKPQEVTETKKQTATKSGGGTSEVTYYKTPSGGLLQNITSGDSSQYRVIGDGKELGLYKGTITKQQDLKSQVTEKNKLPEILTPKSNKLTNQLNNQQFSKTYLPYEIRGTEQDTSKFINNIPIYSPGTIYTYQTGTEKFQGRDIPFYKTYTIGEDWSSRISTKEESKQLQDYISAEQFKQTGLSKPKSWLGTQYGEVKGSIVKLGSEELYNPKDIQQSFSKYGKPGQVVGGFVAGVLPETKMDLIKTGVILGASAGSGFVVKGVTSAATIGVTKLTGSFGGVIAGTGLKLATIGTGAYLTGGYVLSKGQQFSMAETSFEKSKVIGTTTREFGVGLVGFGLGSKGYDITEGLIRTRGRTLIEIPQGEYPQAPVNQQLGLFQKNIYPELGNKPGAFHTTSQVFWKSGKITPDIGTSELPGLYGSTMISTPFSRIKGSGSKTKLIPNLQDILTPPSKPGVAYLKPEGFRYSPAKVGAWYKPPKKGYADVPGIKTEIEAIFRPEAGSYGFESGKYFVQIKGVKVPLDVFKYSGEGTKALNIKSTFKPSSYSSYKPSALLEPSASITGAFYSSKSYKPSSKSYSSIYPSYAISYNIGSYKPSSYSSSNIRISKSKLSSGLSSKDYRISNTFPSPVLSSGSSMQSIASSTTFPSITKTSKTRQQSIPKLDLPGFNLMNGDTKIKRTKIKTSIKPSFTAQAFDIRGSLPKVGRFGITPLQLRKLPI